jgi:hypothetical protein
VKKITARRKGSLDRTEESKERDIIRGKQKLKISTNRYRNLETQVTKSEKQNIREVTVRTIILKTSTRESKNTYKRDLIRKETLSLLSLLTKDQLLPITLTSFYHTTIMREQAKKLAFRQFSAIKIIKLNLGP